MAELEEIPGVGPATAEGLAEHGFTSVKKLGKAKVKDVAAVPGFGEVRARLVRNAARSTTELQLTKKKAKKSKPKKKGKKGSDG